MCIMQKIELIDAYWPLFTKKTVCAIIKSSNFAEVVIISLRTDLCSLQHLNLLWFSLSCCRARKAALGQ